MAAVIVSDYFYGDESNQFSYFRIPRLLITHPRFKNVSTEAKLLYGLLLDRMGLSEEHGWYDEDGRVFIYYTVEEIAEALCCGRDKAMKLLAELDSKKGIGLIKRIRQGQGKPTKIYVKRFTTREVPPRKEEVSAPDSEVENADVQKSENTTSRSLKRRLPEVEKSDPRYLDHNYPDISYPDPSIHPTRDCVDGYDRFDCRRRLYEKLDYDILCSEYGEETVKGVIELLTDTLCTTKSAVRIGGEEIHISAVRERLEQLDRFHIGYVLDCMQKVSTPIWNIRAYLLAALYQAPTTIDSYYRAAVCADRSR